jgi:AhpD family alkylhydroperoxidase
MVYGHRIMSAVELLTQRDAPLLAQPYFAGGDPGPIAASLAHVPELMELALPFIGSTLGASSMDFRTKEIAILRTSALLHCRYCIASHTPVALDAGLSHGQVHALRNEAQISDVFDGPDQTLIAWIDAVAGRDPIPGALEARVREQLDDHVIVELTLLVGTTLLLNRYATALPVGEATVQRLAAEGMVLT